MNHSVTVSAPGKLLLFGDHAVVYGYPSVVTAVGKRLQVTIARADVSKPMIDAPQVKDTRFVEAALRAFGKKNAISMPRIKLATFSPFSGRYGFGSSSAVTVATIKALSIYFEKPITTRELFDMSYQVVVEIQGVGSGFDVAAASYGGTLYYKKGGVVLENIGGEAVKRMPLVVGYTGIKSNTVEIVNRVAINLKNEPGKGKRIMGSIGQLVEQTIEPLQTGDWARVGKLMDFNQEYLRDLGVSSEKLENLISAAKRAGAYGAKLSGAGGGDCMIAVVPAYKMQAVKDSITKASGEVLDVQTNAEGVKVEK